MFTRCANQQVCALDVGQEEALGQALVEELLAVGIWQFFFGL